MNPFGSLGKALGLTPDYSDAIRQARFNPFDVQSGFGSLNFNQDSNTFTSQLNPQLQGLQQGLFGQLGGMGGQFQGLQEQYGQIDPAQQLALLRQQAAPGEQQQRLDLESRMFSQGRLGASQAYGETGEAGSLFRAQGQADVARQLQAYQQAIQERAMNMAQHQALSQRQSGLFGQLGGLFGMEQGLFGMGGQMTGLGQQAGQYQAGLMGQQAMGEAQAAQGLLSGLIQGASAFATGGASGAVPSGSPSSIPGGVSNMNIGF